MQRPYWPLIGLALVVLAWAGNAGPGRAAPPSPIARPGKPPLPQVTPGQVRPLAAGPRCLGWQVLANPTVGVVYNALTANGPDDVWVAGSDPGEWIHWNGTAWTSGFLVTGHPRALASTGAQDVWAVGYEDSHAWTAHWDGQAWHDVPAPDGGPTGNRLAAIALRAPDDAWAVGAYTDANNWQWPLIEHWDGAQWTVNTGLATAGGRVNAVSARGSNDVWVAGSDAAHQVLLAHWDGQQWTRVTTTFPPGELFGLMLRTPTDGWAVGSFDSGSDNEPLLLHWNGQAWSRTPGPPDASGELRAVVALAADRAWAVGAIGLNSVDTYLLQWDGQAWTRLDSPHSTLGSSHLFAMTADHDRVWAAGDTTDEDGVPQSLLMQVSDPFGDVDATHPFQEYITGLACRAIINGYACGGPGEPCDPARTPYFRPAGTLTRGQFAKILSGAAGFREVVSATQQTFADVPPTQPFWPFIERLAGRGVVNGYACGGPGEPCDPQQRPYFRPGLNVVRGQVAKMTANAAGFADAIPTTRQTFADVPPTQPFWLYIERAAAHSVISGYRCGGPGEPCDGQNRPYFRPASDTTRGQAAKFAASTFFQGHLIPHYYAVMWVEITMFFPIIHGQLSDAGWPVAGQPVTILNTASSSCSLSLQFTTDQAGQVQYWGFHPCPPPGWWCHVWVNAWATFFTPDGGWVQAGANYELDNGCQNPPPSTAPGGPAPGGGK